MRQLICAVSIVTILDILTQQAAAYSLYPPNIDFKLKGDMVILVNHHKIGSGDCKTAWYAKTQKSGGGKLKRISISGKKPACMIEHTQNLPAEITITGPNSASANFGWYYPKEVAECLPTPVQMSVNGSGIWTFNAQIGTCNISGTLTSTPPVTIAP